MAAQLGACAVQMRHGRRGDLWRIQGTGTNEEQVRTRLSRTEHRGSTHRAKAPMHDVAAVGSAPEVAQLTFDGHRITGKRCVHGGAACAEVLAQSTPTGPGRDGLSVYPVSNRAAQTSAGDRHVPARASLL